MDLKIKSDLFLGSQEINHFKDSLGKNGYRRIFKQAVVTYGVVRASNDPSFDSLKVIPTSIDKVGVKAGFAIDNNIDVIELKADESDALTIPNDDTIRYVVIKYAPTTTEAGTVNIQSDGSIIGTDTLFTERLRGLPNIASKISFPDSLLNTGEYSIQAIQSDTLGSLNVAAGAIAADTNQKYKVVGSFTSGIVVPTSSKYPFEGDGYIIELRDNDTVIADQEFILAEVKYNGVDLTIYDKRLTNKFSLVDESTKAISPTNQVIGFESSKYDSLRAAQDTNLVQIGWGLSSQSGDWSMDATAQELTLTDASGGAWGGVSPFVSGDFDGWNVIFKDTGQVVNIETSTKVSTTVVLALDFQATYPTTGEIYVVPSCDFVELTITNISNPTAVRRLSYASGSRYCIVGIQSGVESIVKWRHLKEDQSTVEAVLNTGSYINENSFERSGLQVSNNTSISIDGRITPLVSPTNMYDHLIPCGLIAMWAGSIVEVPTGWFLCNGENGTPNLSSKFVVGYHQDDPVFGAIGNTGGEAEVTLTVGQMPVHTHTGTAFGGNHTHEFLDTIWSETNTEGWSPPAGYGIQNLGATTVVGSDSGLDTDNEYLFYKERTTGLAANLSMAVTLSSAGNDEAHNNLPPYFTLAFIMKELCETPSTPTGTVGNLINIDELGFYKNDADAAANGVPLNGAYKAAKINTLGLKHGDLVTRQA